MLPYESNHSCRMPSDRGPAAEAARGGKWLNFGADFVAGGLAGMVSKTLTAPIERVKLLLQVQHIHTGIPSEKRYKGVVDCFKRVNAEQGSLSFWRGNMANVARFIPSQALNFSLRDQFRGVFLRGVNVEQDFGKFFCYSLASGAASGGTSLLLLYPFDYARTRVGADVGVGSQRAFSGGIDCIRKTVVAEGVRGVYRGFDVAFAGIIVWRGLYFGCYDTLTARLLGGRKGGTLFQRWCIAQSVTTLAGSAVYPIDTVRRRMMMQGGQGTAAVYRGSLHAFQTIWRTEGYRGFFRGLSANMVRGVGGSLLLVLYDEVRSLLNQQESRDPT